ncbi:MAG: gliding motility-associated ABC transporter permease subunit GldF, partial [Flavobacteriaceae bacterium]|nr:gliding motility-associated ABC transporter permease subunit GldF [Flavobacteriaceae bacterium]
MIAIFKKEINSFFSSATAYLVIGLFLLVSGLFLWVFKGEFNILYNGFADLTPFFSLAPWIFLFLVPAVSMRSFAEEKRQGTFEMLLTKPTSKFNIVAGKYLAVLALAVLALIPSLLYVVAVHSLGNPTGNIDLGSTAGSYLGLIFLVASYAAIGVFASSLTANQIVSFILAVFVSFALYIGFESASDAIPDSGLDKLGMSSHYRSVGQGVIDSRDIIYFTGVIVLFLLATTLSINGSIRKKKVIKPIVMTLTAVVLLH